MARDYGRVRASFWDDPDIKDCSPAAKMMALYLLTSQHTNAIGLFRLPVAYMQDDTGLTKKEIETAFAELRKISFVQWCERHPWVWIRKYLKHNPPENPNVWRKCVKELQAVPQECLQSVEAVADVLADIGIEPRMTGTKGGVTEAETTILERYRNGIETVVGKENNPSAGLTPLPSPLPEPIPEPLPNQQDATPQADVAVVVEQPISLPVGVSQQLWADFRDHRRKLRASMTLRAEAILLRQIEELRKGGHDPTAVIEQSISQGWKGIFAIGGTNGAGHRQTKTEQWKDGIRQFLDAGNEGERGDEAACGTPSADHPRASGEGNGAAGRGLSAEPRPRADSVEIPGFLRRAQVIEH